MLTSCLTLSTLTCWGTTSSNSTPGLNVDLTSRSHTNDKSSPSSPCPLTPESWKLGGCGWVLKGRTVCEPLNQQEIYFGTKSFQNTLDVTPILKTQYTYSSYITVWGSTSQMSIVTRKEHFNEWWWLMIDVLSWLEFQLLPICVYKMSCHLTYLFNPCLIMNGRTRKN